MPAIEKNHLVQKRNILNEMRSSQMTLQELRFLAIYLSKINKENEATRLVRFSISAFKNIMELEGRVNINHMKKVTDRLLCKIVHIPNERGGFTAFQLFKECVVDMDAKGEWYVEIDAHDKALELMFAYKNEYVSYRLANVLRVTSTNQMRMYEILKQYETIGYRIFSVDTLKQLLGIKEGEYQRFGDFKADVLTVCQKSLKKNTDIEFTFEPYGKKGKGGKINQLKFTIKKNKNFHDPITLETFADEETFGTPVPEAWAGSERSEQPAPDAPSADTDGDNYFIHTLYPFLSEACDNEFSQTEMQVLYNLAIRIVPFRSGRENMQQDIYNYLKHKYDMLNWRASATRINSRMGYFKKMIEADLEV